MNGSSAPLVLLAGDLREAVAGRAPTRLEIDRGVVRRVGADGRTASWDVSDRRMNPTPDDGSGSGTTYAFVTPPLARPGGLAGTGEWLVHSTADGVRRWIPLAGPTAPVRAVVAPETGRAVLEFGGASLDLTPRVASDLPQLTRCLADSGVPVHRVAAVEPPVESPVEPSGLPGDARVDSSIFVAVVLGAMLAALAVRPELVGATLPMGVAAGLALVLALTGLLSRRALRRAAQ